MEPVKRRKLEDEKEETKLEEETTLSSDHVDGDNKEDEEEGEEEEGEEEEEEKEEVLPVYYDSSDYEDYEKPEFKEYYQQIRDSRGFYMPPLPANVKVIPPMGRLVNHLERVQSHSEAAIEFYNQKHGQCYVFDKVLRANYRACGGILYYITFTATATDPADSVDHLIHEFEAKVKDCPNGTLDVWECCLKTTPEFKESQYTHP